MKRPARKKGPRPYAYGTTIPIDVSRGEVEALLGKHGATHFGILREPEGVTIVFQLAGLRVRRIVAVPTKGTPQEREREHRRRWRALVLILKAKLEIVAGGESTLIREFLADAMLPNGQTVDEEIAPALLKAMSAGTMPRLALPAGAP